MIATVEGTSIAAWLLVVATAILAAFTAWLAWNARRSAKHAAAEVALASADLTEMRIASQLPAVMDLVHEYRGTRMRIARAIVDRIPPLDPHKPTQLRPYQREAAGHVARYLDYVGMLVAQGLLSPEPLAVFFAGSTQDMWRILGPYIYRERDLRQKPHHRKHFEHLAAVFSDVNLQESLENLKRYDPSGE